MAMPPAAMPVLLLVTLIFLGGGVITGYATTGFICAVVVPLVIALRLIALGAHDPHFMRVRSQTSNFWRGRKVRIFLVGGADAMADGEGGAS